MGLDYQISNPALSAKTRTARGIYFTAASSTTTDTYQ